MKIEIMGVTVELHEQDIEEIKASISERIVDVVTGEVVHRIGESEEWKELRRVIYHSCLGKIREGIINQWKAAENNVGPVSPMIDALTGDDEPGGDS